MDAKLSTTWSRNMADSAYRSVQPWGERVMVARDAMPEAVGSIALPQSARVRPARGVVLAVGSGRLTAGGWHEPAGVAVGDRVMFFDYAGDEFKLDGESVLLMHEAEILAVLGG